MRRAHKYPSKMGQFMTDTEAGMPAGATTADPQLVFPGPEHIPAADSQPQDATRGRQDPAHLAGAERMRMVPYGALAEERARRRNLQRELQESRERLQAMLETRQDSAAGQPIASTGEAPTDMGSETAAAEVAAAESPQEDLAAGQAEGAFRTQILQSVRSYVRTQPDFLDAYQHARQARIGELSALGYGPEEAAAITFDNELEVIRNAYATGRNPAQVIYDYAVQRGYANGGASSMPGNAPPFGGEVLPAPGGMSAAEKVALAARGQAGAKSLSSAGGGALGPLTLEALASLTDDEFAEATKGDRWHRLLRGS